MGRLDLQHAKGRHAALLAFLLLVLALGAASLLSQEADPSVRVAALRTLIRTLRPLHRKMPPPGPFDWLALHQEDGQSFKEYLACDPTLPQGQRRVLYLQPIGAFTPEQRRIVERTAEFMGLYYGLPVKTLEDLPLSVVPRKARRSAPDLNAEQLLTTHLLHQVLAPRLPEDAAALVGLTASDLWPGMGWHFVFGQASVRERVGVWSLRRLGDPSRGAGAFRLVLLRTLGTATHETGHMFTLRHCIRYACNMNGSETLEESDRQPLELCPECLAKVCWATGVGPLERFRKLEAFCREAGLRGEERFYRKCVGMLENR